MVFFKGLQSSKDEVYKRHFQDLFINITKSIN